MTFEKKHILLGGSIVLLAAIAFGSFVFLSAPESRVAAPVEVVTIPQSPTPTPTLEPTTEPIATEIESIKEDIPAPRLAPALDESDAEIISDFQLLPQATEAISLIDKNEIARKMVRAIYGLSEGKIIKEFRPIKSPEGIFLAKKIGRQTEDNQQEMYRISRENHERYSRYISAFSFINDSLLIDFYHFYSPVLEKSYNELGVGSGNFHDTLIKAVDIILDAPQEDTAILLVQPSVMYKYHDAEMEKLPNVYKLMLRMGPENSEALKLELKKFRLNLLQQKSKA
ncbi:MAG: hypothetical protein ACI9Y1_001566 [Lentisphaeria bacterium]|jgi:hypothetical protein